MTAQTADYTPIRDARKLDQEKFIEAFRMVVDSMPISAPGDAETGLTAEEQRVLREGGLTLKPTPGPESLSGDG